MKSPFPLLLIASLAACSEVPAPMPVAAQQPQAASPAAAQHEWGRRIYNFRCYFCHGYSGDSQTLASSYLNPRPRDFQATSPEQLSRDRMLDVLKNGTSGTAMRGFEGILQSAEMAAVTDFVRNEFMIAKAPNTRYHTKEAGWPDHERYAAAFPFASGKIALDSPVDQLTPEQRAGRRLYMSTCVSCHDRAKVADAGSPWESRPLSYPRNGFVPGDTAKVDTVSGASPYALHERVPQLSNLSPRERRGEKVFQENCAFCHGADGTGKNWIGSFLEPHPRDLTDPAFMSAMTRERLAEVIREGLPETSMPAWKSVLPQADIQAAIAYIARAFHPLAPAIPRPAAKGAAPKPALAAPAAAPG
ncbi:c-type cytochrome [Rhodoferax sp.]|uniref:c-type cytochrome n=1 Tax=Rhodoferax sp. TaxID=50421 RepID=UPI00275855FE|nr:cytochrome c [Rhodoferax sp.]